MSKDDKDRSDPSFFDWKEIGAVLGYTVAVPILDEIFEKIKESKDDGALSKIIRRYL